jgi:hypothetical protein
MERVICERRILSKARSSYNYYIVCRALVRQREPWVPGYFTTQMLHNYIARSDSIDYK